MVAHFCMWRFQKLLDFKLYIQYIRLSNKNELGEQMKKLNKKQLAELSDVETEDEMLNFITSPDVDKKENFSYDEIMTFLWHSYYVTFKRLSPEVDARIRKMQLDKQYMLEKLTNWYDNCYGEKW